MKAILQTRYGPPEILQLAEVEKPAPKADEVLVKIHASSVNIADYYSLTGGITRLFNGISKPKDPRFGRDFAGVVEAAGSAVSEYQPGDEVFGLCAGAFAEFACPRRPNIALKPTNLSFEEAAAVPVAAITALQGLRDKGKVQPGQKVLVNGASGGVGTFAVQIARAFGAEVTAVCSPRSLELVRSLGAAQVVDYTRADITRSGQRFDLILGVNGYHSIFAYRRILAPHGIYVMVGASSKYVLQTLLQVAALGPLLSKAGGQQLGFMGVAKINHADLVTLKELLEARKIVPVVDQSFPMSEAARALRYLGYEHPRAKVAVSIIPPAS